MIQFEHMEGIGILTMSRPNRTNAFTYDMYTQYSDYLDACSADSTIKAVIIQGANDNFSSGNDLEDFLANGISLKNNDALSPPERAVKTLCYFNKPIIGAVEGAAAGFGATMLLHFDRVIMAEGSYLLYPFSNIGVVPEAGSTMLLPKAVGLLKAKKLLVEASPINQDEAFHLGLATDLAPKAEALNEALKITKELIRKPIEALYKTKSLIRGSSDELWA
ncbi:MAG: enoyl-CoA hydratase-related protein, partial [Pseudomonadota bacterium]